MATATRLKLGPADHGRPLTNGEAEAGEYAGGYKYEIIEGKLYVSPAANAPENRSEMWLVRKLLNYADDNPTVVNYVTTKARVLGPARRRRTGDVAGTRHRRLPRLSAGGGRRAA